MATLISTYTARPLLSDDMIVRTAPVSVDFIHGKELHYHPECKNHAESTWIRLRMRGFGIESGDAQCTVAPSIGDLFLILGDDTGTPSDENKKSGSSSSSERKKRASTNTREKKKRKEKGGFRTAPRLRYWIGSYRDSSSSSSFSPSSSSTSSSSTMNVTWHNCWWTPASVCGGGRAFHHGPTKSPELIGHVESSFVVMHFRKGKLLPRNEWEFEQLLLCFMAQHIWKVPGITSITDGFIVVPRAIYLGIDEHYYHGPQWSPELIPRVSRYERDIQRAISASLSATTNNNNNNNNNSNPSSLPTHHDDDDGDNFCISTLLIPPPPLSLPSLVSSSSPSSFSSLSLSQSQSSSSELCLASFGTAIPLTTSATVSSSPPPPPPPCLSPTLLLTSLETPSLTKPSTTTALDLSVTSTVSKKSPVDEIILSSSSSSPIDYVILTPSPLVVHGDMTIPYIDMSTSDEKEEEKEKEEMVDRKSSEKVWRSASPQVVRTYYDDDDDTIAATLVTLKHDAMSTSSSSRLQLLSPSPSPSPPPSPLSLSNSPSSRATLHSDIHQMVVGQTVARGNTYGPIMRSRVYPFGSFPSEEEEEEEEKKQKEENVSQIITLDPRTGQAPRVVCNIIRRSNTHPCYALEWDSLGMQPFDLMAHTEKHYNGGGSGCDNGGGGGGGECTDNDADYEKPIVAVRLNSPSWWKMPVFGLFLGWNRETEKCRIQWCASPEDVIRGRATAAAGTVLFNVGEISRREILGRVLYCPTTLSELWRFHVYTAALLSTTHHSQITSPRVAKPLINTCIYNNRKPLSRHGYYLVPNSKLTSALPFLYGVTPSNLYKAPRTATKPQSILSSPPPSSSSSSSSSSSLPSLLLLSKPTRLLGKPLESLGRVRSRKRTTTTTTIVTETIGAIGDDDDDNNNVLSKKYKKQIV